MDRNHRSEFGRILQNRVGQLFFVCQTCSCEFLSLESLTKHRTLVHGANQLPDFSKTSGKSAEDRNRSVGPVEYKTAAKVKNTSVGIAKFYGAARSRPSATITTSTHPSFVKSPSSESSNDETILPISPGKYKCINCLKKFDALVDLDAHGQQCQMRSPLKCDYCIRTFRTAKGLRIHIHTHHKSSLPFICKVCPSSFNRRCELMLHRRKHENNKPIHCDFCEKIFLSAYERADHMKRRHQLAKFQCKDCMFQTMYEAVLLRHQLTH